MAGNGLIRATGVVAALWNGFGVFTYLAHVGLVGGAPTAAAMPAWVTAAYAIGVFAGLGGAIGLALARRWARPVLWVSLVALVVDWGWVLGVGNGGSVAIGVTVLAVAVLLVAVAERGARRGVLG
jgi:hypothetical protein